MGDEKYLIGQSNAILEYSILGMPGMRRQKIKVYDSGVIEVKEGSSRILVNDNPGLRTLRIPGEQARSYVDRLVAAGFFNFDDHYRPVLPVFDGRHESMTVRSDVRTKTIKCENARPPTREFDEVVRELSEIVEKTE